MAPAGSLARMRKAVLDRALGGEVSMVQACRDAGWSRSRFYELKRRYLAYGEAGLLPKPRPSARPDRRLPAPLVDQIVAYAVGHPTEGPRSIAARLALPRFGSWSVSHGGVSNALGRGGPGPAERPGGRGGVAGRLRGRTDHRAGPAGAPGEGGHPPPHRLRHRGGAGVLDTMYVGRLKGVGKIWQYSAVDGRARSASRRSAGGRRAPRPPRRSWSTTSFPPTGRPASPWPRWWWTGARSSRGSSPRPPGAWGSRCTGSRPGPRTSTPSWSASRARWLHLHYRTAFRYRFYTSALDIDADLQAWLRFYNFERPHRGYRTKGRRPAEIFYADKPALLVMKGWDSDEFTPQSVRS